jgi:intein/homing endonuclease
MFLLEGNSGTGKTTTISHFIQWAIDSNLFHSIALAAPTHKAIKVLKEMCPPKIRGSIQFMTLHSMLGLKHEITKDGKEVFVRDKKVMTKFPFFDLVIVDESSMIADQLFEEMEEQNYRKMKVLFVGDGNQINPVNHIMSIPMTDSKRKEYNIGHLHLSRIVRQAEGNPIIRYSQEVIHNTFKFQPGQKEMVGETGVVMLSETQVKVMQQLITYYFGSSKFDENADFCKIIAWRNLTVNFYNKYVRNAKYGLKANKIVLDEKLIVDKPIKNEDGDNVLFNTNEDLVVKTLEIKEKQLFDKTSWKYYDCLVAGADRAENIHILHESEETKFSEVLRKMSKAAINETDPVKRVNKWRDYFSFQENFASVKYSYAVTAHNCISEDMKIFIKDRGVIPIKDANVGDFVKNSYGFDKILNKFDSGLKPELLVKTINGYELKCSKDHKILTVDNGKFIFKTLENLNINDYVCLDRQRVSLDDKDDTISPLMGWYLGLLVGDGNYSGNYKKAIHRIELSANGADGEIENMLKPLEEEYKHFDLKLNRYKGCYCHRLQRDSYVIRFIIDNKRFRDYLEDTLGLKRHVAKQFKYTPAIIWKSSLKIQAEYIKGLMDSDGSISKRHRIIRFVNKSKNVIDELAFLLLLQGIVSSITISTKGYYTLSITGTSMKIYAERIGFGLSRKQKFLNKNIYDEGKTNNDNIPFKCEIKKQLRTDFKYLCSAEDPYMCTIFNQFKYFSYKHLQKCMEKYTEYNNMYKLEKQIPPLFEELTRKNYYFDRIESITPSELNIQMYDLEIENNHEFTCNGVVVHNSQGSTYDNVFVMHSDIMLNSNVDERQRILYTAMTRPRNMLYIV